MVQLGLGLKVESCCSGGDSCGRTLIPGFRSAGGGHLVALGRGGADTNMAPSDPKSPPVTPQHVPTPPHTSASAATSIPGSASSRRREQADGQTDRQTGTCRVPRLYCKIVFSWQLQLSRRKLSVPQTLPSPAQGLPGGAEASQREKHPVPSSSRRGASVMGSTAPAGWGARGQEGVPAAPGWLG